MAIKHRDHGGKISSRDRRRGVHWEHRVLLRADADEHEGQGGGSADVRRLRGASAVRRVFVLSLRCCVSLRSRFAPLSILGHICALQLFRFFTFQDRFEFEYGDIRDKDLDALVAGYDYVFYPAALVGEHICKKFPKDAREINQDYAIKVAQACARNGVRRFIFASTCSNFGKQPGDVPVPCTEESPVQGISLYAATKINVENFLLTDPSVAALPCFITRFATVYGLASRVRFDLLIHEFIRDAWVDNEIEIYGPRGWRPMIHVDDAARAVITLFEQSAALGAKEIFNVGGNAQNMRKQYIGELVAARTGCKLKLRHDKGDPRSYRVNFDKLKAATGFQCIFDPVTAIDQIVTCLENKVITEKELNESVNITADDPIRKLQTGLALRYAEGSSEDASKLASKL